MVYHHSDCTSCNWEPYPRKVPPNPVPPFKFTSSSIPVTPSTITTQETTVTETVKNLITDAVTSFVSTTDATIADTTMMSSAENVNLLNSTDIVGLNPVNVTINEVTNSNVTAMLGVMEDTTSSSIINTMENGSMPIGGILTNGTENSDTILTTISEFASSTMKSIMSAVNTTSTTSESPISISHNTPQNASHHHHMYTESDNNLLYVILVIILAVLILIGIILLLIYIRYRKASHHLHNYYDVHPTNDRNNPSDDQHETKDCINDIYVYQQPC